MPAQYPGNSTTKAARAASGGGFESAITLPAFTPLVAQDFTSGAVGESNPDWNRAEYQDSFAKTGTQALSLRTNPADPGGTCGGNQFYGGRQTLPAVVTAGHTIWQRLYMYIPSTFSFGYSYNKWNLLAANANYTGGETSLDFTEVRTIRNESVGEMVAIQLDSGSWHYTTTSSGTDNANNILVIADALPSAVSSGNDIKTGSLAEAQFCGSGVIDGSTSGGLKFLVFSPDSGTARIYLQPLTPHKEVTGGDINRVLVESGSQSIGRIGDTNIPLPRDQWFSLQLAVKVENTTNNNGFVRAWLDDQLIVERTGIQTISSAATGISQWGIGDYWNGLPYTDGGAGRDTFYIDDCIVATDMDGYGAPTATDAAGNPYISPNTFVGDL